MTIRVSCDINKGLIGLPNLVRSPCWVLKRLSWFDALGGWSWAALADDTFSVLSVVLGWMNSCINQSWLAVSFGFQQLLYGLSDNQSKCTGRVASLLPFPRIFCNSSRQIRLETGSISHKCVSRNTISCFLSVFNDRWRAHSKSKSLVYMTAQYSRVVKIYYKISIVWQDHIWK